jgi:hypothetical protein
LAARSSSGRWSIRSARARSSRSAARRWSEHRPGGQGLLGDLHHPSTRLRREPIIVCPCHDGRFNPTRGRVRATPAPCRRDGQRRGRPDLPGRRLT